jgi:hypothetical protein
METVKMGQSDSEPDSVNYNDMPPPAEAVDDLPF